MAYTAAAVHASGACSVHEALRLRSAAAAAAAAAEDPLNSRLQASFLSDVGWVQDMSIKLHGPAHVAALDLALAHEGRGVKGGV